MRIVLDLQAAQAAQLSGDEGHGQQAIALAQAIIRNRGAHEILIVLSDQFQPSIEPIRAVIAPLLPKDNLRVWRSPQWNQTGAAVQPWQRKAAESIREAFLVNLKPDLVHIAWPFEFGENSPVISVGTFTQTLTTAVTFFEALTLRETAPFDSNELEGNAAVFRQIDHLKRAHLWLTLSEAFAHTIAINLRIPGDRIINLNTAHSTLSLESDAPTDEWDAVAHRAIQSFEQILQNQSVASTFNQPIRRPKLAYFSPLPPTKSGIADYSAELLPELSRHYEIDVIVAQDTISDPWINANCAVRDVAGFEAHAHRYDRVLYHFGNSPFHAHMFDLLAKNPGVIMLHDFFLGNIAAWRDLQGHNPQNWVRDLYHSHGYLAVQERFNTQDLSDVAFKYPCNLGVFQQALGVIVHSNFACQLADQWYGAGWSQSWGVIPLLKVPAASISRKVARQTLGLEDDAFVVCSFGLLGSIKQNHRLLHSWLASDLAQDKRSRLVFVGEISEDDYGKKILDTIDDSGCSNQINITGWASENTFRLYLMATDVAVQLRSSSRGETSAAVLDCLNYGLPTIANACGAIAELSGDAVWMLQEDFSNEELTQALEVLWKNPEKRRMLADQAQQIIRTLHAPHDCAEQYFDYIEKCYHTAETSAHGLIQTIGKIHDNPPNEAYLLAVAESIANTFPPKRITRQLFLDVSAICRTDLKTGIQRVVRSLLLEWLNNPPEGFRVEPVHFTNQAGVWQCRYARQYMLKLMECPDGSLLDEVIEPQQGDIFFGADLSGSYIVENEKAGFFTWLQTIGVDIHFIVYDLLPILRPDVFPLDAGKNHLAWLQSITRSADGVVCISRSVANEVAEWVDTNAPTRSRPFKVGWFHLGADIESSVPTKGVPEDAELLLSTLSEYPSFLMVGTIEPRKGYGYSLEAFEQLWEQGLAINLVLVGKPGWMVDSLIDKLNTHPQMGKHLFWLSGISDEYLDRIYAACACLIAASEGEGFGLPLIEAAQKNLPIIAHDIPVFREVAGEHAFYYAEAEPDTLAIAVKQWLDLHAKGEHVRSDKMPWKTWSQSADQVLANILNDQWLHTIEPAIAPQCGSSIHLKEIGLDCS